MNEWPGAPAPEPLTQPRSAMHMLAQVIHDSSGKMPGGKFRY